MRSHQTVLYINLRVTREGYNREALQQDLQKTTSTRSSAYEVIDANGDAAETQVEMINLSAKEFPSGITARQNRGGGGRDFSESDGLWKVAASSDGEAPSEPVEDPLKALDKPDAVV
eukprot:scaffold8828_cov204-Amphora_coffeaeformis.AAC.27